MVHLYAVILIGKTGVEETVENNESKALLLTFHLLRKGGLCHGEGNCIYCKFSSHTGHQGGYKY
jgi:hypothetical protein